MTGRYILFDMAQQSGPIYDSWCGLLVNQRIFSEKVIKCFEVCYSRPPQSTNKVRSTTDKVKVDMKILKIIPNILDFLLFIEVGGVF